MESLGFSEHYIRMLRRGWFSPAKD
jgi:hypothetical protein